MLYLLQNNTRYTKSNNNKCAFLLDARVRVCFCIQHSHNRKMAPFKNQNEMIIRENALNFIERTIFRLLHVWVCARACSRLQENRKQKKLFVCRTTNWASLVYVCMVMVGIDNQNKIFKLWWQSIQFEHQTGCQRVIHVTVK